MNEIGLQSNSFEEVKLQNKWSSTETIYLQDDNGQKKLDEIPKRLPGQADDTTSTSSSEFDVQIFRNASTITPINKLQVQVEDTNVQNKPSYLEFFGVKFVIALLQERNKDPILFLKCVSISMLIFLFFNFATFAIGHDFRILPTLLSTFQSIISLLIIVYICKSSLRTGIVIKLFFVILVVLVGSIFLVQFIYSLLIHVPFNSTPLFILFAFLLFQSLNFLAAQLFIPNFTRYDDPNYQLKYFLYRFASSFFNTFGVMDALSDIVLGIQLIQYPSKKLFIIGIFLIILCNVDYISVHKKIAAPQRVGLIEQFVTILVEVVVLVLTGVVLLDVSKKSEVQYQEDTFLVTVISLTTTIVNLLHNLFLVYYKIKSSKRGYVDEIEMLVG